jgi:hypothetical protein
MFWVLGKAPLAAGLAGRLRVLSPEKYSVKVSPAPHSVKIALLRTGSQ